MLQKLTRLFVFFSLFLLFSTAWADQSLVDSVLNGCKKELESFCNDVTPGEGRLLACLYAHMDKLTTKCEYALYDAAAQLQRAVAALTYVANECDADLEKFCKSVRPGGGRLLDCLNKHDNEIDKRCTQALKDTGLKQGCLRQGCLRQRSEC